jgi:exonuclease III
MSSHIHWQFLFLFFGGLIWIYLSVDETNHSFFPKMALQYSVAHLRSLKGVSRLAPDTYKRCEQLEVLRRPRYIHRSRKKLRNYYYSPPNNIPVVSTITRVLDTTQLDKRHRHINFGNLRSLRPDPDLGICRRASPDLRCALLNTRSLTDKASLLNDIIIDTDLDMLFLTETWQVPNDYLSLNLLTPPGYIFFSQPRLHRRGGGLAVVCRETIKISKIELHDVTTFEYLALKMTGQTSLVVILIYRPPKSPSDFFSDISEILTLVCACHSSVILLGDFNIHENTAQCKELMSVLDCFNLTQNVTFATHSRGHILDLICTSGLNNILVNGSDFALSDHKLINFSCSFPISMSPQKKMLTYRKINSVNSTSFSASIRASTLSECLLSNHPSEICCTYNNALSQILDMHAPVKTRLVPSTRASPWFTPELRMMKTEGRRLERLYRKTGLIVHSLAFKEHLLNYRTVLNNARSTYFSSTIRNSSCRPKSLFAMVNKLTNPPPLVMSGSVELVNCFSKFFSDKLMSHFFHHQTHAYK